MSISRSTFVSLYTIDEEYFSDADADAATPLPSLKAVKKILDNKSQTPPKNESSPARYAPMVRTPLKTPARTPVQAPYQYWKQRKENNVNTPRGKENNVGKSGDKLTKDKIVESYLQRSELPRPKDVDVTNVATISCKCCESINKINRRYSDGGQPISFVYYNHDSSKETKTENPKPSEVKNKRSAKSRAAPPPLRLLRKKPPIVVQVRGDPFAKNYNPNIPLVDHTPHLSKPSNGTCSPKKQPNDLQSASPPKSFRAEPRYLPQARTSNDFYKPSEITHPSPDKWFYPPQDNPIPKNDASRESKVYRNGMYPDSRYRKEFPKKHEENMFLTFPNKQALMDEWNGQSDFLVGPRQREAVEDIIVASAKYHQALGKIRTSLSD